MADIQCFWEGGKSLYGGGGGGGKFVLGGGGGCGGDLITN